MATVPIVTEKTYAEMAALIAASELNLALSYKITDRGDRGLLFRAAAPNRLESTGLRYMLCPATYATGADAYENDWIGQWTAEKQALATEGQLTIRNAHVYVAGAVLSGDAPEVEASGWTLIEKSAFTNNEYVELIFDVIYDFVGDWINKQFDELHNQIGTNKLNALDLGLTENPVDLFDWNLKSIPDIFFYENDLPVSYNVVISGTTFCLNKCIGKMINITAIDVYNNNIQQINNCNGFDYINSNSNYNLSIIGATAIIGGISIYNNVNNGTIEGTFDADVTDASVDKIGTAV